MDTLDVTPLGRPFDPSRPYTQSIFLSRQALHMLWPEHRIFLDRQKWQLLLITGCEVDLVCAAPGWGEPVLLPTKCMVRLEDRYVGK